MSNILICRDVFTHAILIRIDLFIVIITVIIYLYRSIIITSIVHISLHRFIYTEWVLIYILFLLAVVIHLISVFTIVIITKKINMLEIHFCLVYLRFFETSLFKLIDYSIVQTAIIFLIINWASTTKNGIVLNLPYVFKHNFLHLLLMNVGFVLY